MRNCIIDTFPLTEREEQALAEAERAKTRRDFGEQETNLKR